MSFVSALKSIMAHPLTRGMDIDDPRTTALRKRIIAEKPSLRRIYREWYRLLADALPPPPGDVLELGSGAGFLPDVLPGVITSEIFPVPGVRLVLDGQRLPFADDSLRGIVMTDVLHHVPNPRLFFVEATRCVRPGGVVAMIEPWNTVWSRLVYRNLHHEPFEPGAADWSIPPTGPLSGSNQALPWILFQRDRERFEREFPAWELSAVRSMMPLRYLLSGGVSLRDLTPLGLDRLVAAVEPLFSRLGMFAFVALRKRADDPPSPRT